MPDSITDLAHERDGDGELLPVTEEVEVHGESVDVEIYPPTSGQQNEWTRRLEGQGEELEDEIVFKLLEEFCAHDPDDFGATSYADLRPAITNAVSGAILAKLFDAEDTGEFLAELESAVEEATSESGDGGGN